MVLRNPLNDGRDRLVMQVLFRFYKGENKEIRPTVILFIEEDLPLMCPVANILAKALAEPANILHVNALQHRAHFAGRLYTLEKGVSAQAGIPPV